MTERFSAFAERVANAVGHPLAFVTALVMLGLWAIGGVMVGFTHTWLLILSVVAESLAILLLLILQRTTNVGTEAMQLKLNELLRATAAGKERLDIEDKTDAERSAARQRDQHDATQGEQS